jgi:hypothetical protein
MTLANDLVQFLMNLFGDRQAAQDFLNDPEKALEDHGLGGVCSADVDAALPVVLDFAPVTVNASRFDREYNTGGNSARTDDNGGGGSTGGGNHGGGHHGGGHSGGNHGGDDHAHAVQQLHHVVNNYSYTSTVDDRDTITDQSVNQNIWAEGDVDQLFDNDAVVASGDRAIAAGDDADVADSNNIQDSYNTDNSSDNSKDNSINAGKDVNIGNTDIDAVDSFNHEVEVDVDESFNDKSDHSTNDSYNDDSDNSQTEFENIGNTNLDNVGNETIKLDNVGNETTNLDNVGNENTELENVGNEFESTKIELDNVGNETTNLENFGNNEESVSVTEVDAEFTSIEESLIVTDNAAEVNTAVAGEEATIED